MGPGFRGADLEACGFEGMWIGLDWIAFDWIPAGSRTALPSPGKTATLAATATPLARSSPAASLGEGTTLAFAEGSATAPSSPGSATSVVTVFASVVRLYAADPRQYADHPSQQL